MYIIKYLKNAHWGKDIQKVPKKTCGQLPCPQGDPEQCQQKDPEQTRQSHISANWKVEENIVQVLPKHTQIGIGRLRAQNYTLSPGSSYTKPILSRLVQASITLQVDRKVNLVPFLSRPKISACRLKPCYAHLESTHQGSPEFPKPPWFP